MNIFGYPLAIKKRQTITVNGNYINVLDVAISGGRPVVYIMTDGGDTEQKLDVICQGTGANVMDDLVVCKHIRTIVWKQETRNQHTIDRELHFFVEFGKNLKEAGQYADQPTLMPAT